MSLASSMQALSLRPSALGSRASARGTALQPRAACVASASGRSATLEVIAKQNSKKRVRQAAKARLTNKARKSEVATRIKKVLVAVAEAQSAGGEAALSAVQALLSQAYKTIDKAAGKGVLKKNTAARRKSLVARAVTSLSAAAAPAAAAAKEAA